MGAAGLLSPLSLDQRPGVSSLLTGLPCITVEMINHEVLQCRCHAEHSEGTCHRQS